jgi:hypothetical protein
MAVAAAVAGGAVAGIVATRCGSAGSGAAVASAPVPPVLTIGTPVITVDKP